MTGDNRDTELWESLGDGCHNDAPNESTLPVLCGPLPLNLGWLTNLRFISYQESAA